MKGRAFLSLLGIGTVSGALPAYARREPKFDVAAPLLRAEKGAALTIEELDANFRNLHQRVARLESMA